MVKLNFVLIFYIYFYAGIVGAIYGLGICGLRYQRKRGDKQKRYSNTQAPILKYSTCIIRIRPTEIYI